MATCSCGNERKDTFPCCYTCFQIKKQKGNQVFETVSVDLKLVNEKLIGLPCERCSSGKLTLSTKKTGDLFLGCSNWKSHSKI